jgi:hypothetical protein
MAGGLSANRSAPGYGFQDLVSFLLLSKLQGSGFYPGEIILTECTSFPLDTPPCRFIPAQSARLDVSIPSAFPGQRGYEPRFLDMAPLI